MKKNLIKTLAYSLTAVAALTFGSCSSDDHYDVTGNPNNLAYFRAGSANSNEFTATVSHTPVGDFSDLSIKLPVYIQRSVAAGTTMKVAVDNSLVDAYNAENTTTYTAIPEVAVQVVKDYVTFKADTLASTDSIEVQLAEAQLAQLTAESYLMPLRITTVGGGAVSSEERGIIYVKVNTQEDFIHVSNSDVLSGTIAHTPVGSFGGITLDLPAQVANAAKVGATATIAIDNSLVDAYNAQNSTNYQPAPAGVLTIETASVQIAQGATASTENFKATIPEDKLATLTAPAYLIPLRISVQRTDGQSVADAGVVYLVVNTKETIVNSDATEPLGTMISTDVMATWTATDANGNSANINQMIQERNNSYWNSGTYVIDMQEAHKVSTVGIMSYYGMYGYFPDHLGVEVSEDGANWTEVGYVGGGDYYETGEFTSYGSYYGCMVLYSGVNARYLRLDMGGIWNSYPVIALRVWETTEE